MDETFVVLFLLVKSDPTKANLEGFLEQLHGPFPGDENVSGFRVGVRADFNRADLIIVDITAKSMPAT